MRVPAPEHVAVAVARTNTIRAIRIDIEREGNFHLHTWEHVLTARELERILALPLYMRAAEAQIVGCAKEAVAKAAGRRIEPTEVEIECDPAAGNYTAVWKATVGDSARSAEIWRRRRTRSQGFVLAAVVLPQKPEHPAHLGYRSANSNCHPSERFSWTKDASGRTECW